MLHFVASQVPKTGQGFPDLSTAVCGEIRRRAPASSRTRLEARLEARQFDDLGGENEEWVVVCEENCSDS